MNRMTIGNGRPTLQAFFLESSASDPDAQALIIGEQSWTYAEIEHQARVWAKALQDGCGSAVRRVGIFAYRSHTAYTAVLASLFAGATYVPLNRTFPVERTLYMIRQADLDAIIVDNSSLDQLRQLLPDLPPNLLIVSPETSDIMGIGERTRVYDAALLEQVQSLADLPAVAGEADAYLLFTSGSTGRPKGVPISHNNVASFLEWNLHKYGFTREDRFTQTFDLTFDLSVFDLFMAWGSGGCLCVLQPIELLAPFQFLRRNNITVWFSVPSLIALYRKKNLLQPGCLQTLRWSLFCGEALPQTSAEIWQEAAPRSRLENLYGPTELTIACAFYPWEPESSPAQCVNGVVPIGTVYGHLEHLVVDDALLPVEAGQAGELCVTGAQMYRGYWQDDAKTAERTFSHNSKLYYRTGDIVRWTEDRYVYLGRADHQVKINGYRIELGEIEAVLRSGSNVVEAAAVSWPIENGYAQGLVAFVSGNRIDTEELNRLCRTQLPSYMRPSQIVVKDPIPYNVNGKIDYNALREQLNAERLVQS